MSKYVTKQRSALLSYLTAHADERHTAQDIAAALRDCGVSLSAVYRNLADMERTGEIRRDVCDGMRDAYYRYVGAPMCRGCIHLSCKFCGRSRHMEARDASALLSSVQKNSGFFVDSGDTVLYGICADCARKATAGEELTKP